ncbi:MAG TPA: cache domain-containing protein [Pseudodesulfovibrio sp.]|nr:cache domain-containing protein [Pseudodesulfovibrio sp.]
MAQEKTAHYLKYAPARVLLPSALMLLLFAGSIFLYLLPSIKQALLDAQKEKVVELTDTVTGTLAHLNEMAERGEITLDYAKELGAEFVKQTRYGPNAKNYFWITNMTPRMVMHPYRPDLDGQDLTGYRDKEGKRIFMEFVRAARKSQDAFVDYYWQWRDQPDRIAHKLSHVRLFAPWGWVIGTGLYTDDGH